MVTCGCYIIMKPQGPPQSPFQASPQRKLEITYMPHILSVAIITALSLIRLLGFLQQSEESSHNRSSVAAQGVIFQASVSISCHVTGVKKVWALQLKLKLRVHLITFGQFGAAEQAVNTNTGFSSCKETQINFISSLLPWSNHLLKVCV